MACIELSESAEEGGTFPIFLTFPDEDGNNRVPNVLTWSLYDNRMNVINNRLDVVALPGIEVPVVLSGDDLLLVRGTSPWRILVAKATYDSDIGTDLPINNSCRFRIVNLEGE